MQANKALLLSAMLSSSESIENVEIATFDASCVSTPDISVDLEPIQAGTGDPSPDNIRPISGRSEVSVTRTGKNLLDPAYRANTASNVTYYRGSSGLLLKANQSYTLSVSSPSAQLTFTRISDNTNIALNYGKSSLTYTPTEDISVSFDAYYAGIYPVPEGGTSAVNVQLEKGSSATAYEPYTGTPYTIQLGQTVYGGTVDVTKGVLKVTKAYATLNDSTKWKTSTSSSVNFEYDVSFSNAKNTGNSYDGLICSYVSVRYGSEPYGRWLGSSQHKFGIKWASGTLTDIQADATAGRIAICYELATPVEVTLTPHEIQTLIGENNVWSDSGNISVRNITCDADFLRLFLMTKLIGGC